LKQAVGVKHEYNWEIDQILNFNLIDLLGISIWGSDTNSNKEQIFM